MKKAEFSAPVGLRNARITDPFWASRMELVRTRMIPYQWQALNDKIPGAEPSWCMHNYRAAARLRQAGEVIRAQQNIIFFAKPDDPQHPQDDKFYGFAFQDTDLTKWLQAVAYTLTWHPDEELMRTADEAIDLMEKAQMEDGYLDTCYQLQGIDNAFTNLRDFHELYCFGHLTEAAVAYYQATGKRKLLDIACRYADCIARHIGPEDGKLHGYPGHEIAEMALIRLWQATSQDKYLDLCRYFIDERGKEPNFFVEELKQRGEKPGPDFVHDRLQYHQAHAPVRQQDEAVGHSVRAMYLYSGMADAARITGDEQLAEACRRLWQSTCEEKRYITGAIGATVAGEAFSYPFDLPNDSAYAETCAAIGLVFFARRMLQLEPDSRYADVMEQALHNAVLSGIALDGESFFYVNPLQVVPRACHRDERLKHVLPVRQKWFACACCPPNAARLISSLADYAWTANDDTLFTHLYLSGEVTVPMNGKQITLCMESDLQQTGHAAATIRAAEAVTATLAFRLPGWSSGCTVSCDGKTADIRNGYAYLSGTWQNGDVVTIDASVRVRIMMADERVQQDIGCVAFTRGGITYCAEEADNGTDLHRIVICPELLGKHCEQVKEKEIVINGVSATALVLPAKRRSTAARSLYTEYTPPVLEDCTLTLIPYSFWSNRGEGEMRVWLHTEG